MYKTNLYHYLKFYFIAGHQKNRPSISSQVKQAVSGGATMVLYKNKSFTPDNINEVFQLADFLKLNKIPLIINDDILLAKAVKADGLHLEQNKNKISSAIKVLGEDKIFGISLSNMGELEKTNLQNFDYISAGIDFIKKVSKKTKIPIVASGKITPDLTKNIIKAGASGISVISDVKKNIKETSLLFSKALGLNENKIIEKPIDEFELIDNLKKFPSFINKNLKKGAGDDAALLKTLKKPVISTDTQREDIHFKTQWMSFYQIGYKAASISLSDLAASYAVPESLFINLGIPPYISQKDIMDLYQGINDNIKRFNTSIGGGNISSAEKLSIDLFCTGEGGNIFPLKSNAKKGQLICTTGFLGLAKAGLEIVEKQIKGFNLLKKAFTSPEPRFEQAKILENLQIDCVSDISDGLYGDLTHIAKQSQLTAKITPETFIFHGELEKFCLQNKKNAAEYIISGGEDYELLFTCSKDKFDDVRKKIKNAFITGFFESFSGEYIKSEIKGKSFRHGNKVQSY
ncbi:MAG: thiamine-phosphate kinase [Deltaproteobacteria bacterium]|nr:MAG: thiamine-phosphate kinase [Deltaproteobacteria bacterium]